MPGMLKMSNAGKSAPTRKIVSKLTRPRLKSFVVMRRDELRGHWVVLSPERILTLDEVARSILKLADGARSVDDIVTNLAKAFQAPRDVIAGDVIEFLQELSDQLLLDI